METEIFLLWNNMTKEAKNNYLDGNIAYDEGSQQSYTGPRFHTNYFTRHVIDTGIPSVLYPVFKEAFHSNEPVYINYKLMYSRFRFVNRSLKERKKLERSKSISSRKDPALDRNDKIIKKHIEGFILLAEYLKTKKHLAYWISTKDIDKVKLPTSYIDTSKKRTKAVYVPKMEEDVVVPKMEEQSSNPGKKYFIIRINSEIDAKNPCLIIENNELGVGIGSSVILESFIENQILFLYHAKIHVIIKDKTGKRLAFLSDLKKFETPTIRSKLVIEKLNSISNYNEIDQIKSITSEVFITILNDIINPGGSLYNDDLKSDYKQDVKQFSIRCNICNANILSSDYQQHSEQNHIHCTLCNIDVIKSEYQQYSEQNHIEKFMSEKLFVDDKDDSNQMNNLTYKKKLKQVTDLTILPEERKREHRDIDIALRNPRFTYYVLSAYEYRCAICGIQLNLVEAAHIVPVRNNETDEITNGIALCHNHHSAFDKYLIIINTDYKIMLNPNQVKELKNLKQDSGLNELESLVNRSIFLPIEKKYYPNKGYLNKRISIMSNHIQIVSNDKKNSPIKSVNLCNHKDNIDTKNNPNSIMDLPYYKYDLFPKKKEQEYSRDWE